MSYFDVLRDLGLVTDHGDIRQCFEERYEGIIIQDKIRLNWLWEETEDYEAWDMLHTDTYAKEFIFNLFMHLQIGGAVNQFDNNISDYLAVTKNMYKDLICVQKDAETNQIKVQSYCFKIEELQGAGSLFSSKNKEHP